MIIMVLSTSLRSAGTACLHFTIKRFEPITRLIHFVGTETIPDKNTILISELFYFFINLVVIVVHASLSCTMNSMV